MVSQIEEERTNENGECECLVQHHHQREQEKEQEQDHERRNRKTTTMFFNELERRRKDRKTGEPVQTRNKWSALVFGQFVALIATSMNATSYTLEYGMKKVFPMFLMFFSYTILSLHLCWSSSSTSSNQSSSSSVSEDEARYRIPFTNVKLRTPWYYYLCLSILDIGPNYLTLLAMTQTSFTSATLLGSLTIPSAMIFCNILLGKVYRPMHFVGVFLCMMGGSITILTDMGVTSSSSSSSSDNNHPNSYTGDILAVVAAVGYGVGDAAAEFWSKHVDRKEYLGMIGLFGSLWTLIASFVYEREAIIDLFADKQMLLPTLGIICWYIVSLVAYYIFESTFLTKSDATLLNLSLQTSNFYAILFSVIAFREIPDIQFFVATVFVISGVFVYELCGNNDYYSTQRFCQRKQHDNELINNNGDVVTSQKTIYQSIETINI